MQALFKGDALSHHMEDSYYAAMGRAVGFVAVVGEDVVPIEAGTIKLLATATAEALAPEAAETDTSNA
jgi:hypothetical protein